jgi:hypothetical protein
VLPADDELGALAEALEMPADDVGDPFQTGLVDRGRPQDERRFLAGTSVLTRFGDPRKEIAAAHVEDEPLAAVDGLDGQSVAEMLGELLGVALGAGSADLGMSSGHDDLRIGGGRPR